MASAGGRQLPAVGNCGADANAGCPFKPAGAGFSSTIQTNHPRGSAKSAVAFSLAFLRVLRASVLKTSNWLLS